ncbi:MAG: CpaF family protein, partial [Tabrizicola sp.]
MAPVSQVADKAPFAAAARAAQQPVVQQRAAAEAMAADKEKKRKERLTELKVEIHKRLLEDLNLSAIESAT